MTALVLLSAWQQSQVELWRKISEYPGYDVSSFGRIRGWWQHKKGGIRGERVIGTEGPRYFKLNLKQWHGYVSVSLYQPNSTAIRQKNGCQNRKTVFVHRLVAAAFTANPEALPEVNHKNLISSDNRDGNLEYTTRKRNDEHAKQGIHYKNRGSRKRLSPAEVSELRTMLDAGTKYDVIARYFDVTWRSVCNIATGKTHSRKS